MPLQVRVERGDLVPLERAPGDWVRKAAARHEIHGERASVKPGETCRSEAEAKAEAEAEPGQV
jgi:hypothetical protein